MNPINICIMIIFPISVCFSSPAKKSTTTAEPSTTARPLCEGFTCPNNDLDGGLHPFDKDGCSSQFCDCVQGNNRISKITFLMTSSLPRSSIPDGMPNSFSSFVL